MAQTADEKILEKLRKLYELAKQGVGGERVNAENALYALLEKYGLTIDAVDDNRKELHEFDCKKKHHTLLCNCFVNYFGGNERFQQDLHIWNYTYNKAKILVKINCTPWEFTEFRELFDWHCKNYDREWRKIRKSFCGAYIQKHNIYATERNEWFNEMMAKRKDRKPDFDEMLLQSGLALGMDNVSHRKAIESGNTSNNQ